jgi:septal ring factor EnvC (AmiA/AmiB activator)
LPKPGDTGILLPAMKNQIGVIVLVVVCIGLLIGVVVVRKQATEQQRQDAEKIETLSNKWVKTSADLDEQRQVAAMIEKDLEGQKKAFAGLTNNFSQVSADLSQTSTKLAQTESSLKASQEDVAKRDAKITELEAQNQALDKQALDLSTAITNLTTQIADTQKKLSASEGDKAFLQNELKRLMGEKAELERQFNDLTVLRAQVSKLKEELNIARRLDWIRQGLFASSDQKGAQKLMQGMGSASAQPKPPKPTYDLNVEVSADGSVKVIPPLTNSAPFSPLPAK